MIVESYEDVIVLSGALRANYWETLHTAISLMLKRHPSGVIIDCSGLTEATPKGASTFRDVMEFITNQDGRVIVAAVPENILEVLRSVTQVRSQLAIADSVEDARASLDLLVEEKPQKRRPVFETRIVVCVTGREVDHDAVELATQIMASREAELHLVYVILVPRDLPLTAPLPKEEGYASKMIEGARHMVVDRHLSVVPHIERGRDIATTLQELVDRLHACTIIYPVCDSVDSADGNGRVVSSLLQKVNQQVILVRGQVTQPVKPAAEKQ